MTTETYILPAFWSAALINADLSGYTESEIKEIEYFTQNNSAENCRFNCIHCSNETFFSYRNDANNMGNDVTVFTFDISQLNNEDFNERDIDGIEFFYSLEDCF